MKPVVLITGASSGIGKATALELHKHGFCVYGAARRLERMEELRKTGIKILALDVTVEESVSACIETVLKEEGRIDILVNNAGYGFYGAVEDVPLGEARQQFEVNLFGLARMTQLVLPVMRKNKRGKIVNISSMAGRMHTPYGAWYHAAKFAVEGFSACLRMEVAPWGIDVILIEPGLIKTAWDKIAVEHLRKVSAEGAYAESSSRVAAAMARMYAGKRLTKPEKIARVIRKAVMARKPAPRYVAGYLARFSILMRAWLPGRWYDKIIMKIEKV